MLKRKKEREITRRQIQAISSIDEICEKIFREREPGYIGPEVTRMYLTSEGMTKEWFDYTTQERTDNLGKHQKGLEGRSVTDIGYFIYPECASNNFARRVGQRFLRMLVGESSITETERKREIHYRNSVRARGSVQKAFKYTPYSKEEREDLIRLAKDSECQHTSGRNKGRCNWEKITQKLNEKYGNHRSAGTYKRVCGILREEQKNKKLLNSCFFIKPQ